MVGPGGVEPPTSRLSGVRSNHLSYEPLRVGKGLAPAQVYSRRKGQEGGDECPGRSKNQSGTPEGCKDRSLERR